MTELAQRFAPIYTGAITDVLFSLGLGAQTLPHQVSPIAPGHRLVGRAFTAEWNPYLSGKPDRSWELLKTVPTGEVLVVATPISEVSVLGDLAVAHLAARKVGGLVVDGGCRDIGISATLGLPIFCRFHTPQDASHGRGEVGNWGQEITIGEVQIRPGDLVVGDADGVVIIPAELTTEVLTKCESLVAQETEWRTALLAGADPDEVFAESGH